MLAFYRREPALFLPPLAIGKSHPHALVPVATEEEPLTNTREVRNRFIAKFFFQPAPAAEYSSYVSGLASNFGR